jgi:hypothetical protein
MKNVDKKRYQDAQDKENRASVHVAALVEVISFDPNEMTVVVKPLSKYLENGAWQSQSQILDVPVSYTKSGGFIIRPWFKRGDIGLVVYVDHDIDNAVATASECVPNTERNHSTSDAIFVGAIVPGTKPQKALPAEAFVISNEDETVYLAVYQDKIEAIVEGTEIIVEPEKITMNTQDVVINAGGNIDMTAAGDINITAGGNLNDTASAINHNG